MDDVARTYGLVEGDGGGAGKTNQPASVMGSGQDRRHPRLNHLSRYSTSGSSSSTCRDLNYCEVYFVSPTKHRSKENLQMVPTSPIHGNCRDGTGGSVATDQYNSLSSENSFVLNPYSRNRVYDSNCDVYETRSHFSDSVAIIPNQENLARTNNVTFSGEERIHSNRGSLKRTKGRSNQSLCSCDADTEIIPNPNRPLYQYSLDRRNRTHTYTCEQNAQILMRIERDRDRRKSLTSTTTTAPIMVMSSNEKKASIKRKLTNRTCDKSTFSTVYRNGNQSLESDSTTDVDSIPPPPPPVSLNRKAIAASYRQQTELFNGPAKSATATESMLNDCTSTILNCANVGGHHMPNSKPDLCNINQTDFTKIHSNQENIPMTPYPPHIRDDTYMPCFKSKADGGDNSLYLYHHESPQYAPNFDNRPHAGKFNTIGPSSYFSKSLSGDSSCHPSAKGYIREADGDGLGVTTPFISDTLPNRRYFSQSLSNFSFNHLPSSDNPTTGDNAGGGDADGYRWHHPHSQESCTAPYAQFKTPAKGLSCSFGESTFMDSSYTTLGSSTSGLKEKFSPMDQQQVQHAGSTMGMPWKHRQCPSRGSSSSGTSSLRLDPSKHWLAVSSILLIIGAASVAVPLALRVAASAPFEERLRAATQLLDEVPLIDGHNDLPWNIRKFLHNKLNDFNFDVDLRTVMPWARSHWSHTDLKRLKQGRVAAQFWAAYVPCEAQHRDAVQLTLEQIDVIKRLTERYSKELTTCTSAADIIEAHKDHKICSLTGVEGGHSLGGSLAVLRTLYAIGVRYLTLTSTCHTPWADSSHADAPKYDVKHGGLTVFGKTIIREMNRLGMIVDLSHVSTGTMRDALATSEAPVIFSHSSAYELCNSSRNVQDDILQSITKNRGLVMVNFYSKFLSCSDNSTVQDAVAHINHIKRVAGIDHVGLGAGFDGINFTPKGLEDVSSYPTLFAELLGDGWSVEDLSKLAGQNFLRVMSEVEKIRDAKKLAGERPYEDHPSFRSEDPYNCTSS